MNDKQLLAWRNPTWIERNGELITALLGAAAIGVAVTLIVVGLVAS